ncbi:Bro-N domain-containing protein [Gallibacterium anatis]|uniref:BRO-N domain-containing protein n=1 Tax=Gallibacterium anatis TaxID=750 RepID=UPI00254D9C9C|nr:Bro-N domain-containing protein [Gallibacterium anatis]MDK9560989.1 Bro-N domain-containing protein [Gallibacterium anatis]
MTTLTFQNKNLSVINQNNQLWMTVTEIGNALGYSDPFKSVKNIYDRHAEEFTPNMTALIEMQTNGGMQKVRIFSLRGCHLIGMLSHTKVAKDFRKWVLDILDKETQQPQQQNLPLAEAEADEEAIRIIANLYHSLNGAYEMGEKIRKEYPHLGRDIDKFIGGHYLYNLNMPTENALTKARKYVQAKSERIMFIKGMLSLLEEQPQPKRLNNF